MIEKNVATSLVASILIRNADMILGRFQKCVDMNGEQVGTEIIKDTPIYGSIKKIACIVWKRNWNKSHPAVSLIFF